MHLMLVWILLLGSCAFPAQNGPIRRADGQKSRVAQVQSSNMAVVGHIGGPGLAVLARGNYVYLALAAELAVVDISAPQHPQRVGYIRIPARHLTMTGDYLYVGGLAYPLLLAF